ncbi:hypothetical protein [Clostridium sp. YIM B02506]|uniref:hypothetical protein n=1 Tax=Clostridium sp. YIM B02506 TaxID=2910680 RepID=UPI001EEE2B22|nr:hypothetical protein [Clostridium sp. YIM B02506]
MSLEELINKEDFTIKDFTDYINECGGVGKLKKTDLDKILKKHDYILISNEFFFSIYKMVSENDYGKTIKVWTWIVGISTIASTIYTIISFYVK